MAIIVALKVCKEQIRNRHLLLFCDNSATCDIVNTGKVSNEFTQECLREICYLTARINTVVKVVFKPGVENRIPDFLSRWYTGDEFRNKFEKETEGIEVKEVIINPELFVFSHQW